MKMQEGRQLLLGAIADDLTGGSELAAMLVARGVPSWALLAGAGAFGLLGLGLILGGWQAGIVSALIATAALSTSGAMAALRGEEKRAQGVEWAIAGLFALVAIACGRDEWVRIDSVTPLVLALVAVAAQLLVERVQVRHRRWWASPAAHLLLLTPFALAGFSRFGLAASAIYAFATLFAAVEGTREKA